MSKLQRKKKIIQLSFIILCLFATVMLARYQLRLDFKNDTLKDIKIESIDKAIRISWDASLLTNIKNVAIKITDSGNEICEETQIKPFWQSYKFKDGITNERYNISIIAIYKDGHEENLITEYRMLLDLDELPDLPTLFITTNSGNDPSANHVDAPEGMWGTTAIDNNYEAGVLVYKSKKSDNKTIEANIRISVRGNTSSLNEKKPYKIILDRAVDLIGTEQSGSHNKWLLLNTGTTINNYMGQLLSEYCRMEWVAQGTCVNVFLNGDWRGLYTLIEPVAQEASHELISQGGCIIENDAYWWNANDVYFRLEGQIEQMGYTFKYPLIESVEDDMFKNINNLMQNIVDMSDNNDANTWNFADIETFTSWLLVHDIAQWGDGGGSNIYYYIQDFSDDVDEEKQKVKMGPVWDCDVMFNSRTFSDDHALSAQHYQNVFPFVNNSAFMKRYIEKWNELSDGIMPFFNNKFDELIEESGDSINQSRVLDMKRWGTTPEYLSVEDELLTAANWLENHVEYLNLQYGE